MKGGRPLHLMRFYPTDYVNDPSVKLALATRNWAASTFYPHFLFHAFLEGGTLPEDPKEVAAVVGMPVKEVVRAILFWTNAGKLRRKHGRLYHRRVKKDVQEALHLRAEDAERKRRARSGGHETDVREVSKPPDPLAGSVPGSYDPDTGSRAVHARAIRSSRSRSRGGHVAEAIAQELEAIARELEVKTGQPASHWLSRASMIEADTARAARSFEDPRASWVTEPWAQVTLKKIRETLEQVQRPVPL